MFDAQHFRNSVDYSIDDDVIRMHDKLARPLDSPYTPKHWMLVEFFCLLHQQVTHFNRRPRVVLSDVLGNTLAVGNGGRFP